VHRARDETETCFKSLGGTWYLYLEQD
jgi:hypothetical protein